MASFDHVALRVTDLDRAVGFYTDTVGLSLVSRSENGTQAVFQVGDALLVLFCRERNQSVPDGTAFGTDHTALLEGDHYEQVLDRLRDGDLILRGPTVNKGAQGDGLATYFGDPDGNELEIKTYGKAMAPRGRSDIGGRLASENGSYPDRMTVNRVLLDLVQMNKPDGNPKECDQ